MDTPSGALIEEQVLALQRHAGATVASSAASAMGRYADLVTLGAPVEVAS